MADVVTFQRFWQRRDTAANWTSANPTLASGEFGYETDTKRLKIGDGATAWNSLDYHVDAERVRDVMGTALVAGSNVTITVNDPGDTITIAAAGGGGGSGSLIKLGEVVVTSATTDIDFTGLDLETDGRYMLVASHVPNAAGAQTVRLYYNGDTTTANYYRAFMGSDGANPAYGGGGVEAEIYASGDTSTPYHALAEVILSKAAGHRAHAISRVARYTSTGSFGVLNYSHVRFSSTDNVTSLKLRNSVTNGFGVGTRVALYRLA